MEELLKLLRYEDGVLYWRVRVAQRCPAGAVTSQSKNSDGYLQVEFKRKKHKTHRLVWQMHFGVIPSGMQVDHIDGNRSNNAIENLRLVSAAGNAQNQRQASRNNETGLLGVSRRSNGKWQARIRKDYAAIHIGTYDTKEAAHAAYIQKKQSVHETCSI
jgi:hypothetical protein